MRVSLWGLCEKVEVMELKNERGQRTKETADEKWVSSVGDVDLLGFWRFKGTYSSARAFHYLL